jgi:hypothetical protein
MMLGSGESKVLEALPFRLPVFPTHVLDACIAQSHRVSVSPLISYLSPSGAV